jgi:hypothetical protein
VKRILPTLILFAALGVSARAQGFDYATSHQHKRVATKTYLWVGRDIAPSAVPFRFNFLGNVMRLRDDAGREVRLYYDFDRLDRITGSVVLIATLEGSRVNVTYDAACGMVLDIGVRPVSAAPPLRRDTLSGDSPTPTLKFPRNKTSRF